MSKLYRLFPLLLLISAISIFPVVNVFANDTGKKEVDIKLSPNDILFEINNMKPGDWVPRTVTVKNVGRNDFSYRMELRNTGEEKLFNELLLEVIANGIEVHVGKLAEFQSMPERKLISGTEENLDITIRFPEHLGNEFQGLTSSFVLTFIAEGKKIIIIDDPEEPDDPSTDGDDPTIDDGDPPTDGDDPAIDDGDPPTDGDDPAIDDGDPPTDGDDPAIDDGDPPTDGDDPTKDGGNPPIGGGKLPVTATTLFNLLLIGSVLVASGIVLMIVSYFRRVKLSQ